MTRTEEDLRAAYSTPLDASALQRLSLTIGELSEPAEHEPRPRSHGRRLAPLLSAAAVLVLAGGVAVGVNHRDDRSARSGASPTANEDPALRLWAHFPVHASPRPVVLTGGAINEDKIASMARGFDLATALPPDRTTKDGQRVITADNALSILQETWRAPSATTSLKITDVRLGADTFSTDRGQQSLPAWVFTFAGVAQPASVLAIPAADRWPRPGMPTTGSPHPGMTVGFDTSVTVAADGSRLTLSFTGARPGTGPCSAEYAADVAQSATAVSLSVRTLPNPDRNPTTVCTTEGYKRTLTITLRRALGNRVVVDSRGAPIPGT